MTKEDLHEIKLISQAGAYLLMVNEHGGWMEMRIMNDSVSVQAMYGEELSWSVPLRGASAVAEAISRYWRDGNETDLRRLTTE